jgi:uncharacterized protein (DUF983 family)
MGRMKELFIDLQEEREEKEMYYGHTPSDNPCPNCGETKMVEQITESDFECLYCGYQLIKLEDGTLKIS